MIFKPRMDTGGRVLCMNQQIMIKNLKTPFDPLVKRNRYSYTKFSSAAQAGGDCGRWQMEQSLEFCQRHDLRLNETC